MILFLTFVAHRFASGIRNGAMYAAKPALAKVFGFAVMPTIAAGILHITKKFDGFAFLPPIAKTYGAPGMIGVSVLFTLLCLAYIAPPRNTKASKLLRDLHLWTTGEQTALFFGALIGCGIPGIAPLLLAVYPSVFLQKCAINVGVGRGPFFNGTDDPTGKYYSIPALGLKIPRTGQVFRLIMSVASITILILITR